MVTRMFYRFQSVVKRLFFVLISAVMMLGLVHPAALAVDVPTSDVDVTAPDVAAPTAQKSLAQRRRERQAWQEKASASRNVDDEIDSVEEVVDDRLNLDEIVEDNVIVEGIRDLFGADNK